MTRTYQEFLDDLRGGLDGERHGADGDTGPDSTDRLITDQIDEDLGNVGRLDRWQDVEQDLTGTHGHRDVQPARHTGIQTNTSTVTG